jgi:hypothetical protein
VGCYRWKRHRRVRALMRRERGGLGAVIPSGTPRRDHAPMPCVPLLGATTSTANQPARLALDYRRDSRPRLGHPVLRVTGGKGASESFLFG